MHNFRERVYAAVRAIPSGHVATYGQIAIAAGSPRASRAVGNILHTNPDPIYTPCFRIVNAQGCLTKNFAFGGIKQQKRMLIDDGICVVDNKVDLKKYQVDTDLLKKLASKQK